MPISNSLIYVTEKSSERKKIYDCSSGTRIKYLKDPFFTARKRKSCTFSHSSQHMGHSLGCSGVLAKNPCICKFEGKDLVTCISIIFIIAVLINT